MSSRMTPSGFVKNVAQNGVGRYVCQLQRLTFRFCKSHGGSRGVRDFLENRLLDFTRANPGVVVYVKPRRHRPAKLTAEYLNGNAHTIHAQMLSEEELCKWVDYLHSRSGVPLVRLRKMWHTDNPSIQGVWHPFLNKDTALNVTSLPDPELSQFHSKKQSATEKLLEMARQLKLYDQKTPPLSGDEQTHAEHSQQDSRQ
ncbi:large ribosomal subunit protein mL43-like [Liolophura sinensis]|uniref:large ribosomal subunit protein mL43-like n=1 Tax=Liolophura sinensis TaxID=3198878 RepID=UPI0031588A25